MKKDIGYNVAKKSSTLLEFVLKEGPLPYGMDFLVKKDAEDGGEMKALLYHGKEWLHVDAADDSSVVVEVLLLDGIRSIYVSSSLEGLLTVTLSF